MRFLFVVLLLIVSPAFATVTMTRVDPSIFIHQPLVDFKAISIEDALIKEQLVKAIFEQDLISHELSIAFEGKGADFQAYYNRFQKDYLVMDLNKDGVNELIFSGYITREDDKEHFQIYASVGGKMKCVYDEIGHLFAYKLQKNTGEILLFHHQYPCCVNASHNLNRLRFVEGKIQLVKRYFVGRDTDMKGTFFPKKVTFRSTYDSLLINEEELRWSGSVINEKAWVGRTEKNVIARYPKGAIYKVLAKEKGWLFVLMHVAPSDEVGNRVINPKNFLDVAIYGWIKG